MRKILGTLLLGTFCLTMACATDPFTFDSHAQMTPPPAPVDNLRKPTPKAGSMYVANRADFYTDIKAHQVGDIITVEITETSKAKKKNDTKAERTSEFKAGIPYLMGYESTLIPNYDDMTKTNRPMLGADFKSKTDAKAELTKEDTMSAAIGCTVMEVLPNGNLIIKGQREIQVNGETQYILLHGTVRASDVTSNNSVLSTQLADARIHYTGRGVLTDKQKPGWLTRLMDSIWPF